jgi:hypothetical protein
MLALPAPTQETECDEAGGEEWECGGKAVKATLRGIQRTAVTAPILAQKKIIPHPETIRAHSHYANDCSAAGPDRDPTEKPWSWGPSVFA